MAKSGLADLLKDLDSFFTNFTSYVPNGESACEMVM